MGLPMGLTVTELRTKDFFLLFPLLNNARKHESRVRGPMGRSFDYIATFALGSITTRSLVGDFHEMGTSVWEQKDRGSEKLQACRVYG